MNTFVENFLIDTVQLCVSPIVSEVGAFILAGFLTKSLVVHFNLNKVQAQEKRYFAENTEVTDETPRHLPDPTKFKNDSGSESISNTTETNSMSTSSGGFFSDLYDFMSRKIYSAFKQVYDFINYFTDDPKVTVAIISTVILIGGVAFRQYVVFPWISHHYSFVANFPSYKTFFPEQADTYNSTDIYYGPDNSTLRDIVLTNLAVNTEGSQKMHERFFCLYLKNRGYCPEINFAKLAMEEKHQFFKKFILSIAPHDYAARRNDYLRQVGNSTPGSAKVGLLRDLRTLNVTNPAPFIAALNKYSIAVSRYETQAAEHFAKALRSTQAWDSYQKLRAATYYKQVALLLKNPNLYQQLNKL